MRITRKYKQIQIVNIDERKSDDFLTLRECGVCQGEKFYADIYDDGLAWIRAKRDNADKTILAGDNLSVDCSDYVEVEE